MSHGGETGPAQSPAANISEHGSDATTNGADTMKKKGRFSVQFSKGSSSRQSSSAPRLAVQNITKDNSVDTLPEENVVLQVDHMEGKKSLYLYEEDMKTMPRVATFLELLFMAGSHTVYPSEKEEKAAKKQPKKAKLGVMLGVYLPTIQHILGLLMFIRHAWFFGCTGVLEGFAMVFVCCLTTFVTSISLSAIATNGMVQAGGGYYMLSRNLGPECGGSIGVCFYLANTFATTMYLLGAIEILLLLVMLLVIFTSSLLYNLLYMVPEMAIFGDIHHNPWNNFRVYGTISMLILTLIVAVGVKFVQIFAPISLACVIISFFSIVIGALISNPENKNLWVCFLGDKLLESPKHSVASEAFNSTVVVITDWCTKNITGDIWHRYCSTVNDTTLCDKYFIENDVRIIAAIPGFSSGVILRNAFPSYMSAGDVTVGVAGDRKRGEVVSDMTTGFIALCAIYFPSVTGILTGANMSGDLKDPQKSIPSGTIFAQLTCSFIFILLVFVYGGTTEGAVLRDKFGSSVGGGLLSALLCWPNPWVVLIGAFASSIGAALQCLVSAPRLLQAIARDDIIPFLSVFKVTSCNNEPIRALILTFFIAEIGILIANIDSVAPVIDVFFLMCYMFVNVICALQTLLKMPNWRPRFKYYHWTLSVVGVILNLTLSIIAGWYYALAAFAIAAFIYKYIEYKGGVKAWGDGISGLTMSTAQKALLTLDEEPHTKNWRPQLLILSKLQEQQLIPEQTRLLSLAAQLKAGKGLTVVASVLKGDFLQRADEIEAVQKHLKEAMEEERVKGFAKVMVNSSVAEGISVFIQTIGLGALQHNTVMMGWPENWHQANNDCSMKLFIDTVRTVEARGLSLLVPRGIENFPSRSSRLSGTIDVWWIVHDGGMLILLSFLLQQNKVWKDCHIRIFTVAEITDNSIQIKKDLETFLYQIRIHAEVHVQEMYDSDISAYTYEKTMDMERRLKIMRELQKTESRPGSLVHRNSFPSFRHREPSITPSSVKRTDDHPTAGHMTMPDGDNDEQDNNDVHFTFSPHTATQAMLSATAAQMASPPKTSANDNSKSAEADQAFHGKLLRMHTAVQLNHSIQEKSSSAQIVILNFPAPPSKSSAEENYMEYLEVLSEGLPRVLMVRGSGKEVVTMFS